MLPKISMSVYCRAKKKKPSRCVVYSPLLSVHYCYSSVFFQWFEASKKQSYHYF